MTKVAEILFQHRIRFIALALIPIALGGAAAVLFASYPATATLRIEDPSAFGASFVPAGWSAGLTPAQNLADSVGQVVKSRSFSQSLSDELAERGYGLQHHSPPADGCLCCRGPEGESREFTPGDA